MSTRTRILVLSDYYLPGYKAGGAHRLLAGTIEHLGDRFRFALLTRDRDLGDDHPYPRAAGRIEAVGKASCRYLSPERTTVRALGAAIRSTPHDAMFLNSVFSPAFAVTPLILRRLRLIPRVPLLLAPRGELDPGAIELKRTKKRVYLAAARLLRLHRGVIWQASTADEQENIARWFGARSRVRIATDLVEPLVLDQADGRTPKEPGRLRAVFLSRLSPKKNLLFALETLGAVRGDVTFDIYGPVEDARYWRRCQSLIDRLPASVRVRYCGPIEHEQVDEVFRSYDLLFLPTLGENFGCVILEALLAGCPVLISDRTPWRELEAREVGWDLPLVDAERFRSVIEMCCAMPAAEHDHRSQAARRWASGLLSDPRAVREHTTLLETLLA